MEKGIIKKRAKLTGLSCAACENRIETRLNKLQGVSSVRVSYVTSKFDITYDADQVSWETITAAIEKAGYGVEPQAVGQKKEETYFGAELAAIGVALLGVYMLVKNTVGFNFIPEIQPGMGYGILFVVGILTSLHCVAMCGGINLSLCISHKQETVGGKKMAAYMPSLMYNAGRVVSYSIIGGIVGALGSVFHISNTGSAFITLVAGTFMIIMGLNMLNLFPWLRRFNPRMPKVFAGKIQREKQNKGPFVVGLLNGLMPCGPLQAMQLYALGTGSFVAGMLSMLAFSLGTVPLLFAFGALGSFLSSRFTKQMLRVSAILVIVLGILMMNRGVAYAGISLNSVASKTSQSANVSELQGKEQYITTSLKSGGYEPITVQAGIPVVWTIQADEGDLTGCNNKIIIPKYEIEQKLVPGENVIRFTPEETGTFGYSCWMGMIQSSITVIDKAP